MSRNQVNQWYRDSAVKGVVESNGFIKACVVGVIWLMALIPLWICIGLWSLIGPETFWEMFAMMALMIIFGGSTQLGLAMFAIILTGVVIFDT